MMMKKTVIEEKKGYKEDRSRRRRPELIKKGPELKKNNGVEEGYRS